MEPLYFQFSLPEFDLTLLPISESLLRSNPEMLRKAVVNYLAARFENLGGKASIGVTNDQATVSWLPSSLEDHAGLRDFATSLLTQGAYKQAEPILRGLLKHDPEDAPTALNLAMMLSDQRRLDEAIGLLQDVTTKLPDSANAWNALGVAYQRQNKIAEAVNSLRKSLKIEPDNPYTLRNLGALLTESDLTSAINHLRRASEMLPDDQGARYGYALALLRNNQEAEADDAFKAAVEIAPYTQIAELCRTERTKIAHKGMRERGGDLRMDVVMYMLAALNQFEADGKQKTGIIVYEISMLGRSGLDINNPAQKYSLKSLPGKFSGLQLVSIMYAGLKLLEPTADAGIDFSKEYEQAVRMKDGGAT